jgi:hypothetical protein
MIHPAAFDFDPNSKVAIYSLYSRFRVRLWEWPPILRREVLKAVAGADLAIVPKQARIAAAKVMERQRETHLPKVPQAERTPFPLHGLRKGLGSI